MIMVMEPMTIVGAVLGGFLNKVLPVWLTTVLLTVLLVVMAQKLWKKADGMYRKESEAIQQLAITSAPGEALGTDSHPVVRTHLLRAQMHALSLWITYYISQYSDTSHSTCNLCYLL